MFGHVVQQLFEVTDTVLRIWYLHLGNGVEPGPFGSLS